MWILHRPSTNETPQIGTLGPTISYCEAVYSEDRFRASFSILLAPTPDKIIDSPEPNQALIDCALSLHSQLPSDIANNINPLSSRSIENYLIECAVAAVACEILKITQVHAAILELGRDSIVHRFNSAIIK